jgi:hypothetical protein
LGLHARDLAALNPPKPCTLTGTSEYPQSIANSR